MKFDFHQDQAPLIGKAERSWNPECPTSPHQ